MSDLAGTFQQTLLQPSLWTVGLAFAGGVVSSLLPCTVGMLPLMVGYIGGYAAPDRGSVLRQALGFILGLATVMTALGVAAVLLGRTFGTLVGEGWYAVTGVLALLIGLNLLGVLHLPLPPGLKSLPKTPAGSLFAPFLLGMAFGATSSPCGTPFLAGILALMSQQTQWAFGGLCLFAYALGQGVLLLAVGLFTGLLRHLATLRRVGVVLNTASGGLFVVVGTMLLLQSVGMLSPVMMALGLLK